MSQPLATIGFRLGSIKRLQTLLGDITFRGQSAVGVAAQAAVSRTITTGTTLIARRIKEEINLPIAKIKQAIDSKRGSFEKPEGVIIITRRATWLADFAGAQFRSAKGKKRRRAPLKIRVRLKPSGSYGTVQIIDRAFLGVVPRSTKPGVFQRAGKSRLPLKRLRGPSALGIFMNVHGEGGAKTILEESVRNLGEVLEKNLNSQIDRFLK